MKKLSLLAVIFALTPGMSAFAEDTQLELRAEAIWKVEVIKQHEIGFAAEATAPIIFTWNPATQSFPEAVPALFKARITVDNDATLPSEMVLSVYRSDGNLTGPGGNVEVGLQFGRAPGSDMTTNAGAPDRDRLTQLLNDMSANPGTAAGDDGWISYSDLYARIVTPDTPQGQRDLAEGVYTGELVANFILGWTVDPDETTP